MTWAAPPTPAAAPLIGATSMRAYASDLVDLDARLDRQMGAWLAVTSTRRAEDGASLPHGITSCVLLPTVMRFSAYVCAPRMAEIAAALGDPIRPAADQVEALVARLGLPTRIGQLGVARDRLAVIAQRGNPWVHTNARRMDSVAGLQALLEAAWDCARRAASARGLAAGRRCGRAQRGRLRARARVLSVP